MMRNLKAPSPSMVVALVALFVALGGTGYAASQSGPDTARPAAKKKKTVRRGPRGRRGIQGVQGTGHAGPPGADGTRWAAGAQGRQGR
jgi:hypothetical protein